MQTTDISQLYDLYLQQVAAECYLETPNSLSVKRRKVETVVWVKLGFLRIRLYEEEILFFRQ